MLVSPITPTPSLPRLPTPTLPTPTLPDLPALPGLPAGPMNTAALVMSALAVAIIAAALYLASCRIWPMANCGRCNGTGKRRSPSGKAFRNCPRCKGTGRRDRLGRKFLDHQKGNH